MIPATGGVVGELLEPVVVAGTHHAHHRWAKECLGSPPARPQIVEDPGARNRTQPPSSSLSADAAPLLAGVKANPSRGGLRPTLTPAPLPARARTQATSNTTSDNVP